MNNEKLKPCPFCGGKAKLHKLGYVSENEIGECVHVHTSNDIRCTMCGAEMHIRCTDESKSIEAWNRRE